MCKLARVVRVLPNLSVFVFYKLTSTPFLHLNKQIKYQKYTAALNSRRLKDEYSLSAPGRSLFVARQRPVFKTSATRTNSLYRKQWCTGTGFHVLHYNSITRPFDTWSWKYVHLHFEYGFCVSSPSVTVSCLGIRNGHNQDLGELPNLLINLIYIRYKGIGEELQQCSENIIT